MPAKRDRKSGFERALAAFGPVRPVLFSIGTAVLAFGLSRLWWGLDEAMVPADVVWPLDALVALLLVRTSRGAAQDAALLGGAIAGQIAARSISLGWSPLVFIGPLGGAVETWAMAWAARRLIAAGTDRASPMEVARFAALAFVAAPAVTGAVTAGLGTVLHPPPDPISILIGVRGPPPTWLSALHWWGRHALGAMVVLPAGLLLNREAAARISTTKTRLEAAGVAGVVCAAAGVVFAQGDPSLSLLVAPGLVLAVFAFGAPGAAAAIFLTAIIAVTLTAFGFGPLAKTANLSPIKAAVAFQGFLALCWTVALPSGLLLERLAARIEGGPDGRRVRRGETHFLFGPLAAGPAVAHPGVAARAEIWTPGREGRVRLSVSDIERLEAEGDYVRIHTSVGNRFVRGALKAYAAQLDPELFIRVHRSAVVNCDCVQTVRRKPHGGIELETRSGARIRVGRAFASEVRRRFEL